MTRALRTVAACVGLLGAGVVAGRLSAPRSGPEVTAAPSDGSLAGAVASSDAQLAASALVVAKLGDMERRLRTVERGGAASAPGDDEANERASPPPEPPAPSPEQVRARSQLAELVSAGLAKRVWSDGDRERAYELIRTLPREVADEYADQLLVAINRQELKTESPGFPLVPTFGR